MARPPQLSLRREDFKDLGPGNLDRFFRALNTFGGDVRAALSRGLTDTDNLVASVRELSFATDAAGKIAQQKITHGLPGAARPKQVTIAQAFTVAPTTRATTPVALYGPAWTEGDGQVVVSDIGNLVASTTYRILLLIKGA